MGWRNWVSNVFTWLYIGTQDAWILFAGWLWYKYGHIKFCKRGEEDAPPEFTDAEYFMMTFSAGVAVGLFFYGAAEPIWLYYGYSTTADGNRYTEAAQGGTSQFEDAQWAMTQTIFHWGIHGWIPYQVIGIHTLRFNKIKQLKLNAFSFSICQLFKFNAPDRI